MHFSQRSLALAAAVISVTKAQTPKGFEPSTLVKLGVAFPTINVDPVGSSLQNLDQAQAEPIVTVPNANLLGANGQPDSRQRYMVMMIDTDVIVRNTIRTTVLHWFQPDLVMSTGAVTAVTAAAGNRSSPARAVDEVKGSSTLVKASEFKQDSITGTDLPPNSIGQVNYLPPGPPPGPPHRYVMVLFAQPQNFSVPACFQNVISKPGNPSANAQSRVGFDIDQFLAASKMSARPIAGNYFRAQNPQGGGLTQGAMTTAVVNARCPGVTPGARPAGRAA